MIDKLTKEQTDKFSVYVKEWTEKGLTTEPRTLNEAVEDFTNFQKLVLKRETVAPVVLLDSPFKCWLAVCMFSNKDADKADKLPENLPEFVYPYFDCQFWSGWFAYYEFMKNELKIPLTNEKEYEAFKACSKYGMVFPLENICIVCQPPTIIKKNGNGLHCENGPALSYNGDNEIYALNGVVMKKEHVMTEAENINPEDVMKETNVEVRRELLRKVGIERMMNVLPNRLLDTVDNYELYSIDLNDELKNCKYLKMINPSVGVYHLEAVDPSIETVEQALSWRNNNMFVNAEILT